MNDKINPYDLQAVHKKRGNFLSRIHFVTDDQVPEGVVIMRNATPEEIATPEPPHTCGTCKKWEGRYFTEIDGTHFGCEKMTHDTEGQIAFTYGVSEFYCTKDFGCVLWESNRRREDDNNKGTDKRMASQDLSRCGRY